MKNIILLSLLLLPIWGFSNDGDEKPKGKKVEDSDAICIVYLDGKLQYHAMNKQESAQPLDGLTLSLRKKRYCNIYTKWFNPLIYDISLKDEKSQDPQDKEIATFFERLATQFQNPSGTSTKATIAMDENALSPLASRVSDKLSQEIIDARLKKTDKNYGKKAQDIRNETTKLVALEGALGGTDMAWLYFVLLSREDLDEDDIAAINSVTTELNALNQLAKDDFAKQIKDEFKEITEATNHDDFKNYIDKATTRVKSRKKDISAVTDKAKFIDGLVKKIGVKDTLLKTIFVASVASYVEESIVTLQSASALNDSYSALLEKLVASDKEKVLILGNPQGEYVQLGAADFDEGQIDKITITRTKKALEITDEKFVEGTPKSEGLATFTFEEYSAVTLSLSSGIFYASTTLKSYGVGIDDASHLVVTEDKLEKGSAGAAAFLNVSFPVSRQFAPLIQFGIDPTKKRPFLLAGAGFAFPSARFAISGGPIWTFEQNLNKFSVGQTIASTTELEKDISYKFDVVPRGGYIGLQYNFGTLSSIWGGK